MFHKINYRYEFSLNNSKNELIDSIRNFLIENVFHFQYKPRTNILRKRYLFLKQAIKKSCEQTKRTSRSNEKKLNQNKKKQEI